MKFLDLLYASIYDWYNRMKISGRNVNPSGMVAVMFIISIEGWGLLFFYFFYKYFKNNVPIPSSAVLILFIISIVCGGVLNSYYTSKNRYLDVYDDYISVSTKDVKSKNILTSFGILLFPYVLLILALFI